MKTTLKIEIETKNMKAFGENEDGSGKDVRDEVEKDWHTYLKEAVRELLHKEDIEDLTLEIFETLPEGVEEFKDLGEVEIKVTEEKQKQ